MHHSRRSMIVFMLLAMGVLSILAGHSGAEAENMEEQGPAFIDTSAYPPKMKQLNKLFERKCSKCHTLHRAVSADFNPDKWGSYVEKMHERPGSGISPKLSKKILEFLAYYSEHK